MIAGILHEGSGLGDQLHRYITVRTLAEEKGYEWGMINGLNFKGREFLDIKYSTFDFSDGIIAPPDVTKWVEKDVRENGIDIRSYDPEINFVEDNTIIDGSFEDSKYWHHNLANINKWLAVEPLNVSDDKVLIGFRGGEYATIPDLFLPRRYYIEAVASGPWGINKTYEIHTDDPKLAREFFPNNTIIENQPLSHSKHTNMGLNWRSMRYAKYAIIPNSAFFILPRILKHHEDPTAVTIAPRYWARRNTKGPWRPAAYYKEFTYI